MWERFEQALLRAALARIADVEQAVAACARLDHADAAAAGTGGCRPVMLPKDPDRLAAARALLKHRRVAQLVHGREPVLRAELVGDASPSTTGISAGAAEAAVERAIAAGEVDAWVTVARPTDDEDGPDRGRGARRAPGRTRRRSSRRAAQRAKPTRAEQGLWRTPEGPGDHDAGPP